MFLERLHVPVGICYSRGEEGMRHSNWGKKKKHSHTHIFISISLDARFHMHYIVPSVLSLSSARTFTTGDGAICKKVVVWYLDLKWRLTVFYALLVSINYAGYSLSWPYDDLNPNLYWFLTHVWLCSVSKVLCFTAVALFKTFVSKLNVTAILELMSCYSWTAVWKMCCFCFIYMVQTTGLVCNHNFYIFFSPSSCFSHRYKLWEVSKQGKEDGDTIEAEYDILDCLQMLRRDRRSFSMLTAALEHLRTGEGTDVCSEDWKKLSRTEELCVDRVFVCKACTVKDLSQFKQTGEYNDYTRCEDWQSVSETLVYNPGQ